MNNYLPLLLFCVVMFCFACVYHIVDSVLGISVRSRVEKLESRVEKVEKWIDLQDYFYNYEQRAG